MRPLGAQKTDTATDTIVSIAASVMRKVCHGTIGTWSEALGMRFEQVLCTTYQNPLLSKGKAVNHASAIATDILKILIPA